MARFGNFRGRFTSRSHFILLIRYNLKLDLLSTPFIVFFDCLPLFLDFLLRKRLIIFIFLVEHIGSILENVLLNSIRYRVIYALLEVLFLFRIDLISFHIEDHLLQPFQFGMLITIVADPDYSVARVISRNGIVFGDKTVVLAEIAGLLATLPSDLPS